MTLEELVTLVDNTVTQLEQLLAETVAEVQRIASAVSAELVGQVSAIVDQAVVDIEAEVKPLADLLAPLLPPPTKVKIPNFYIEFETNYRKTSNKHQGLAFNGLYINR